MTAQPADLQKMKDRISMFLAKAESTTFPAERETFSAAAEKLMLKLGITMAELESSGKVKAEQVVRVVRTYTGNYSISYIPFAHAVVEGFGHMTVLQSKGAGLDRHLHIIGHVSDVEQVTRLLDSLEVQAKAALKAWQRETVEVRRYLTDMEKFLQHRSFIEGFGRRVGTRLREARTTEEQAVSTGTALVLVSKQSRVGDYMQENFPKLGKARSTRSQSWVGAAAGDQAGKKATFDSGNLT